MAFLRRWIIFCFVAIVFLYTVFNHFLDIPTSSDTTPHIPDTARPYSGLQSNFKWKNVQKRYPIDSVIPLPSGPAALIPKIQYDFEPETNAERRARLRKLDAVRDSFKHSWEGYKTHAWLQDEVKPLSGTHKNVFGGWGATLVDSLDTLWIMGLWKEFEVAVAALKKIDFTVSQEQHVNVFETTIRYLGGLLSAYDVSEERYPELLDKAIDLGEMLYVAFDTPNHMPVARWDWKNGAENGPQEAEKHTLIAELGSLSLEFTRLTQLSGDPKYYDAIARVTDVLSMHQNTTRLPGMYPIMIDAQSQDFRKDRSFTLGGMADSVYEYFPKQHLLLGGRTPQYRDLYNASISAAQENLFFRPLTPSNRSLLISGTAKSTATNQVRLTPEGQHLTCFAGGMVALAARVFDRPEELDVARQLVDGCVWAYASMPSGIMPEVFTAVPCADPEVDDCEWDEQRWHDAIVAAHKKAEYLGLSREEHAEAVIKQHGLAPGFVDVADGRYMLRPEAIESLFVLYRVTGDEGLREEAWRMFRKIERAARTRIAYAAVQDVRVETPSLEDSMESFWTAETLKYFYLIFSEPGVVSLDEFVLNTEAHPLRRPD